MPSPETPGRKRVPALDKCFGILDLVARSGSPLGISEIARKLDLNKSTVFNMVRTLDDLGVLEQVESGKFGLGMRLHVLANLAGRRSDLIRTVRPYLNEIAGNSNFTAFLGIREGLSAVIIDIVEAPVDIKVAAEVGMRLPLVAGAGGKALLSQLSDEEIDEILASEELRKFTPNSCVDKAAYKADVLRVREERVAFDREEYIEGIVAAATPAPARRSDRTAAIWAVALKRGQWEQDLAATAELLKRVSRELDIRFSSAEATRRSLDSTPG